jgi:hypothetical protein
MNNLHSDEIDKKVEIIMRQTDYDKDKSIEKLKVFQFDEIKVIKDYFGIAEKSKPKVNSLNQEIYRQIRTHLDVAMSDYRERVNKGEVKKVI